MAKDFAKGFYKSKAWKDCRAAYFKAARGLCERCLSRGIYRAGEIVHHKEHISPENIQDPRVLLDWGNLQLVCRDCHAELHADVLGFRAGTHGRREGDRFKMDELGRVVL